MKKFYLTIVLFFLPLISLKCEENFSPSSSNQTLFEEKSPLFENPAESTFRSTFIKMTISLTALIVLLFLTFWLFKRLSRLRLHQANQLKNIKIIEKRMLSPKTCLYLIETEGEKVLMAESQLEVRPIHSFSLKAIKKTSE
ncbi:MAG: flagellar biosynthetic protein FliO [Parachlamydiales bacterium]|nr:flagellar biosynthetic protein FliO [Parachlamydiales bacterium]